MKLHTTIQVMKHQYSPVDFAYNQESSLQVNESIYLPARWPMRQLLNS